PEAREALLGFAWPGNVRQMRNVLRTLVALCDGQRIELQDLPQTVVGMGLPRAGSSGGSDVDCADAIAGQARSYRNDRAPLESAERVALLKVLEANCWHMTRVAEHLGISRNTLYRKLRKHGIARAS
ncbi:helix-turn-helix domain-containing protein, partial [Pseudomonas sp. NBRC 111142]